VTSAAGSTSGRPWRHRLPDPTRLRALGRRSQQVLLLAGLTGVATGLLVAGFEWLTAHILLEQVLHLPLWARLVAPGVGLVLAAAALRWVAGGATPMTADAYIRNFHEHGRRLDPRPAVGRIMASVATLGLGGSLGYEGPSIYGGAVVGSTLQHRLSRLFSPEDAKVLLVSGAAAGVSAIFKAPVTGLVFAMEVPFQEDLARHMILPAAISSAASYVTFVAIAGTDPLLPVAGQPPFNLVDLGGAAVIGLAAGLFARGFLALVVAAKRLAATTRAVRRVAVAAAGLAAVHALGLALADENLTLGPGYDALRWALEPERSVVLVLGVALLRAAATALTLGGGGVGGLFIPLVIQGALLGRIAGGLFDAPNATLFPVVGIAAFLGAGYHVPLAAVVFVAEFTGRPGFVVPGLIAAVVAQLVVGRRSASPYQVAGRVGHLERRLQLPLGTLIQADVATVPLDATVEELFWQHLVGNRQQSVAVVEGNDYLGMVTADDLASLDRAAWATTPVAAVLREDVPVASSSWTVSDAIVAMEEADVDRLPVCEGGRFVGIVAASEIVRLDEILDRTNQGPPR
jgi:CIC family chloride channel protein